MGLAVLTACLTVFGGVLVLAVTQIFLKMVIDPLAEFRKLRGRINTTLILHENVYLNPIHLSEDVSHKERADAVSQDFRSLASELMACYQMLSFKQLLIWLRVIPTRDAVHDASRHLLGLSNGIITYTTYAEFKHDHRKQNESSAQQLARILDLYLR